MVLRAGYMSVALKMQEAADSGDSLSANDIRSRLSDAINDAHRGTGTWAYYIDHFGDGESGDVVYSCDGDTKKAPYNISGGDGAAKCVIDMTAAENVVPRTIYETEQDEPDHYAAMEESLKKAKIYLGLPVYERFIAKAERDAASADDFAGKGKSFPILKPEDVTAAAHSIGRAGSANMGPSGIKARIISIAKRKGWTKQLPKAWQGDTAKESSVSRETSGGLKLSESVAFEIDIPLREAFKPSYQIKLISPGQGSSAFYPAEVLKRDGPKVFKAGTPMRIDHPTRAEEAARPEGSVKDWGAVLAKDAYWLDEHAKGPGLYSEVKPFSDHVQTIDEKGPYAGVSIRANGNALMEGGKPVMRGGVPVLGELLSAEGVDMVTRAGAGGLFLQESARLAQGDEMDEAAITKLVEARVTAELAKIANPVKTLEARALRGDATVEATRVLSGLALLEVSKQRVIENVLRGELPLKDGELDTVKFGELVTAEAKREGVYASQLGGGGLIRGMGPAPVPIDEAAAKRARDLEIAESEDAVGVFQRFGLSEASAKAAVRREVA